MSGKNSVARNFALTLCACAAIVACGDGGEDSVMAGVESLAVANPAIGGLSDPNILAVLDAINVADSATGAVAASKGTDPEVREYGQMMVRDHHEMRVAGKRVADSSGLAPELPANDPGEANQTAAMSTLEQAPRGEGFDRTYIAHAVRMHEEALGTARNAQQSTENPQIRALVQKAIPVIEQHLNRAKEIQQRIGGGDTTAARR
jgi:putative membrane protein